MTATTEGRRALRLAAQELRAAADDLDHRAGMVDAAAPFGAVLAGLIATERAGSALEDYWYAASGLYESGIVNDGEVRRRADLLEMRCGVLARKAKDCQRELREAVA